MVPLPAALSHACGIFVSDADAPLMIADQLGRAGKERPAVVTEHGAAEDVPEAALAAGGSSYLQSPMCCIQLQTLHASED